MAEINILDHQTIDKIAAGEVVERPASVVKELVENAIDAGADAITVEIKDGGISLIRVTDNGGGIEKSQVGNAFLRHATSKISSVQDLTSLVSLGFRGEALASIAAVSMVEMISKTPEDLTGIRYVIEGGVPKEKEEIGAPTGTTMIVRNLFYNTPPRKKFLKQPQTEGSYVADLMEHLAMSNPRVAFKFVFHGQTRFYTTGNNDLKEIIYRIYGREIAKELIPFEKEADGVRVAGLLGKPVINRSNRNYEIFYINGRYIRSTLLSRAVEEGYREYLMQHKFPFCVLHFQIDTDRLDVNVHPTKMEVRIADGSSFYEAVKQAVYDTLHRQEMIPQALLSEEPGEKQTVRQSVPEPFEHRRIQEALSVRAPAIEEIYQKSRRTAEPAEKPAAEPVETSVERQNFSPSEGEPAGVQMELFDDRLLSVKAREQYEILGQLFETYWLIAYQDKLLIIDQHAAHEKVKYERFMKRFYEHDIVSQAVNPPMVVTLNGKERECYLHHAQDFAALGFVIEEFGGSDYAIRGVPMDLYGYEEEQFFYEILDELAEESVTGTPESIRIRIATMACKAAVKGNTRLSREEVQKLIDELLTLENPYHCPHGRPTIISMSKYEIEKKFKRIVT
ncbi:MAG: DNA mismatch repair endonuclease MutL [Clostridiales bacterium]|nr:DNA mismatch repair endonuclease MutL [Clostridiales bacterium]